MSAHISRRPSAPQPSTNSAPLDVESRGSMPRPGLDESRGNTDSSFSMLEGRS